MEKEVLDLYKKGYGINKIASSLKIKKNIVKKIIDKNESVKIKEISKEHIDTEEKTELEKEIVVTNIDVNNNKKENNTSSITNEINKEKLNVLLDNLDKLLKLIQEESSNSDIKLNSDKTTVTSLRINEELYDHVKKYAERKKIKISEILNKALLDYLNNYD